MQRVSSNRFYRGAIVLLILAVFFSVSRAFRFPNDFAEAIWLLNYYEYGFVKRALPGSMLLLASNMISVERSAVFIATVSFFVFCFLIASLISVCCRILFYSSDRRFALLAMLVFLTSPFIVYCSHTMGYLDHLVFIFGIASVALAMRGRFCLACVLQSVSIFSHESASVVTLPVVLGAFIMGGHSPMRLLARFWPLVFPVFAVVAIATLGQTRDSESFRSEYQQHLRAHDFVKQGRAKLVPNWLAQSPGENFEREHRNFAIRVSSPMLHGIVLPTFLALLFSANVLAQLRGNYTAKSILILSPLSPLIIHLFAWDTVRIWTYSIFMVFLLLWVVV